VRVTSGDHKWREVTESVDVSRTGIKLQLTHDAKPGTILVLELPMPLALRSHSHNDQLYVVRAAVRHSADNDSGYLVGAQFENEPPMAAETISEEGIDSQASK
jgi:PilZ domain-containing protein